MAAKRRRKHKYLTSELPFSTFLYVAMVENTNVQLFKKYGKNPYLQPLNKPTNKLINQFRIQKIGVFT
jgi:hypothetical protein